MKNIDVKENAINEKTLDCFDDDYKKDPRNNILRHAFNKNDISSVVYDSKNEDHTNFVFSSEVKTLPVCNQKMSGRCWIFAACNLLREKIAKDLNMENFEISQNFVAFYDKLEKSNYLLSSIVDLIDEDPFDRTLMFLLSNGVSDGGQWDMFVNIVKKYGIVPKNNMNETKQSSGTRESNVLINSLIRQFAAKAQRLHKEGKDEEVASLKAKTIGQIYTLLVNAFGVPPKKFDFEYKDKNNEYHIEKDLTPKAFFDKHVGSWIDEFVSVINSPTKDKPFLKTFTINYLNNVIEGRPIVHLNVPMDRMKELIINQLKNDEVVWFGSDVSNYRDRERGLWDDLSYDYINTFDFDIKFDKEDMLDYHASAMNHAMLLTGVNIVNDLPDKRKIQNSWGADNGIKGYYVMSDSFFNFYVYQAVINKKYLNKDELNALKEKPTELNPWDPMGTLAD